LTLSRSVEAAELADRIRATCASGLRPTEWRAASLVTPDEGFRVQLVVTNAKAGHGRTHGPTRTLRWKDLSIETEKAIERTLDIARSFSSDENYEAYRKRIQDLLHAVSLRLWPERKSHFALYSCRHAAIADAKSIYTRAEVAALFGHATDGSCMSGYPRKKGTSSKGGTVESLRASKVRAPRSKDEEKVGVERSSVHAALRSSMRWRISTRRNTSAVSKTPSTPLLSKSVKGVS
jgi:hypothetical protein